jgi:uncharacterized protein (TIGR02246 family)
MWSSYRAVVLACVIGAVILGSGVLLTATAADKPDAPTAKDDKPLTPAEKEIMAAIKAYNEAIANKDVDGAMGAFIASPDTLVLGTGPGETWRGPEEIRNAHLKFFENFDKETSTPIWRHITVAGDVAWTAGMTQFVDELKGEKNEFMLNSSAVMRKQDGKWRIALLHISNLTGPDEKK